MLRSLRYYRRLAAVVAAGAAVTTAVLTGALMVGDSVRESLRGLALERLGRIDQAVFGERFFRADLAGAVSQALGGADTASLVLLRGSAVHGGSGARASQIQVLGVDERFARLYEGAPPLDFERSPSQVFPSVVINEALRAELSAAVGDDLLLSFGRSSEVPRATLMGDKDPEDLLGTLRVTVSAVLRDEGLGIFGLVPHQRRPLNAFVPLDRLQRAAGENGRANAILLARGAAAEGADAALAGALALDDLGMRVEVAADHLRLESRDYVLRPDVERAAREALDALGATAQPVQTYLATGLRIAGRDVPYSAVSGVDALDGPPWAALRWVAGEPSRPLPARGIVLNEWTARDLGARPGDELELEYLAVGPREELIARSETFRVSGVAALEGLAADGALTPEYPGIQDAQDMAGWDPPFPVDLQRIRPQDEEYWDRYRALPKAFVAYGTAVELWSTRFGHATSIRFGAAPGLDLGETRARVEEALRERLAPSAFGLSFRDVRAEALAAADGATDFGGLFLGFSLFLIVSSALLVGLLFGLSVERRAGEIGLLLAVGYAVRRVRARMLGEGALIAGIGVAAGLALAVGYAALMMAGLRTIWLAAVGSSRLGLHVTAQTLAVGAAVSLAVVLFAIGTRVARLRRVPPARLLAGSLAPERTLGKARASRGVALGALVPGLGSIAWAAASGRLDDPALTLGAGALLLASGLGFFGWWCRAALGTHRPTAAGRHLAGMAARNTAWNPGRSLLSVALVASACFVIVTVAANRGRFGDELASRESGSGGFALVAEAQVPLYQDLDDRAGLAALGFDGAAIARLAGLDAVPLRVLPGEDASCLNLYRPDKPRILGVPPALVERAAFRFRQSLELPAGARSPWDLLLRPAPDGAVPVIGDFNSTQWILHLGLGDTLELSDEKGRPLVLRLVATLDTSVFQSELLISEQAFLEHFPSRGGFGYFLIETPPGAEQALAQELERGLAPFGFDVSTAREKLEGYKAVEHTYLATFQLLGGLGLLLGTVGLGVVLLRNVIERRGELATLRAFGFRRSTLAAMILAENVVLLVTGMALGSAAALVAVAPRLAAIDVPWLSILATLAVVLLAGLLSSLAAVRGALRAPLLPALKAER